MPSCNDIVKDVIHRIEDPADDLVAFVDGLTDGTVSLKARLPEAVGDHRERALRRALNRMAERIASDMAEIATLSNDVSSGIARNGFFLDRIGREGGGQADRMEASIATLAQMVESVADVAKVATRSLQTATHTETTSRTAVDAAGTAATELAAAADTIRRLTDVGAQVASRVAEIASSLDVIEDIAGQTHLLSINANIEAAHAGDRGRTFAVVADEIGKLSDQTAKVTHDIETRLAHVRTEIGAMHGALRGALASTSRLHDTSTHIAGAIASLVSSAEDNRAHATAIASASEEQASALRTLASDVRDAAQRAAESLRASVQAKDLRIGDLNSRMQAIVGHYQLGTFVESALLVADAAAREVEAAFEALLTSGRATLDDLLNPVYRELKGREALALSRLFDVSRVRDRFDPPKYGTAYDAAIDVALCKIVDRYTDEHPDYTAVCVQDLNAFHIAHYRKLRAPITGNPDVDRANNRVKPIFDDRTSLRCARVGLEGADALPPRIGRRELERAGIQMRRKDASRPYLVQSYARDTGEIFNDLSVALYVRGIHYGALSIAYPANRV